MKAALTDPRAARREHLRQVVFLTDGAIGNEQQLFDTIAAMRGRSRVFMVGIGSAPNTFLMTRAAEIGRGTFTHIGSVEQVEERMRALFEKLESPAVTNLAVDASRARQADMTPSVLPDLYRGEPLVLAAKRRIARPARWRSRAGSAIVRGSSRCRSRTPPKARACRSCGRAARSPTPKSARTLRKLDAGRGRQAHPRARRSTISWSRGSPASSRSTRRRAVPTGAPLTRADLPLNLPAGWDFDKVFGERARAGARRRVAPMCRRAVRTQFAMALQPASAPKPLATPRGHRRGRPDRHAAAEDRNRRRAAHDVRCAARHPQLRAADVRPLATRRGAALA